MSDPADAVSDFSNDDLAEVQAGIASAAEETEFSDRKEKLRSVDDLIKAESHIRRNQQTAPRSKQSRLYACKGV